jgi:hypothetical protein
VVFWKVTVAFRWTIHFSSDFLINRPWLRRVGCYWLFTLCGKLLVYEKYAQRFVFADISVKRTTYWYNDKTFWSRFIILFGPSGDPQFQLFVLTPTSPGNLSSVSITSIESNHAILLGRIYGKTTSLSDCSYRSTTADFTANDRYSLMSNGYINALFMVNKA